MKDLIAAFLVAYVWVEVVARLGSLVGLELEREIVAPTVQEAGGFDSPLPTHARESQRPISTGTIGIGNWRIAEGRRTETILRARRYPRGCPCHGMVSASRDFRTRTRTRIKGTWQIASSALHVCLAPCESNAGL
jgi:hypothetical protein